MNLAVHFVAYAFGGLALYAIGCDLWRHRGIIISIITGRDEE
jgi:hypothetical protein